MSLAVSRDLDCRRSLLIFFLLFECVDRVGEKERYDVVEMDMLSGKMSINGLRCSVSGTE